MELTDIQRLAVAEAMGKAIRDVTNPRGGAHGAPTLRTECDDALLERHQWLAYVVIALMAFFMSLEGVSF